MQCCRIRSFEAIANVIGLIFRTFLQKAGRKENDSRSAADMTAFKPAKAGVKKGKGGKGAAGKGKKQQRPGKAKRAQMRGKG